jgi:hypothetical protein
MTKTQLQKLHIARQQVEKLSGGICDRAWFDLVLINLGRCKVEGAILPSSKDLSPTGFERVMAFLEGEQEKLGATVGTYWRDIDRRRGHYLSTRQEWQVREGYFALQQIGTEYTLDGLVKRITAGRVAQVHDMNPSEAQKMIEMIKGIIQRIAGERQANQSPATTTQEAV